MANKKVVSRGPEGREIQLKDTALSAQAAPAVERPSAERADRAQPARSLWLIVGIVGIVAAAGIWGVFSVRNGAAQGGPPDVPINGERAYAFLKQLCDIGRRPSGSPGMHKQQQLLAEHFKRLGGQVRFQEFQSRHPETGEPVPMANLIVHWHPERKDRVLLCAHYDTRPYPDQDPRNKKGVFVGANDGASGTAALFELAHAMPDLQGRYGVDFVLFDAEEFIFSPRESDGYFLGSTHFAREYRANPPQNYRYLAGILLDMVADRELQLYMERNSLRMSAQSKALCRHVWDTAARLGVKEFKARSRHEIRDDHLPLNQIAGIPTIDIIDFDYPRPGLFQSYWHTEQDTPDKCSAESLHKVCWVVLESIRTLR